MSLKIILPSAVSRLRLAQESLPFLQAVFEVAGIHQGKKLALLYRIAFIHKELIEDALLAWTHVHLLYRQQLTAGSDQAGEHSALS